MSGRGCGEEGNVGVVCGQVKGCLPDTARVRRVLALLKEGEGDRKRGL